MSNENEKKALLNESLAFLVESANINNGKLTIEEINSALKDVIEDKEMYTLVYDYILEKKIVIEGYEKSSPLITETVSAFPDDTSDINVDTTLYDDKEKHVVNMYLDELNGIKQLTEEEELIALKDFLNNPEDKNVLSTLTTCNLNLVTSLVEKYRNKGVSNGDLIQEGNLGLIEGIMTYNGTHDLNAFHSYIISTIENALNDAILEQNASSRINAHAADRANEIDRASVNLSKELDRTPTLTELAEYLSLPEDEVERVMKMSLNALTIDNSIEDDE